MVSAHLASEEQRMKWKDLHTADPASLDVAPGEERRQRDYLLKIDHLAPYEVYLALKGRFGESNSDYCDDTKTQWEYFLQSADAYIEIYDWKLSTTSIGVYCKHGKTCDAEKIAHSVVSLLEEEAKKYASIVKSRTKAPEGLVIENPFFLYYETANSILELIHDIEEGSVCVRKDKSPSFLDNFPLFLKRADLARSALLIFLSSAEGFVNLLYELYLKKDLREKRIYDRLSREQIDLKIRLAPIYCECFRGEPIDTENEAFKRFHTLVNLRNDFVHANVTQPMMSAVLHEDGKQFIVGSKATTSIGVSVSFSDLEAQDVEVAKEIVDDLVQLVLRAMSPRFRREFESVMKEEHIAVEIGDGQMFLA